MPVDPEPTTPPPDNRSQHGAPREDAAGERVPYAAAVPDSDSPDTRWGAGFAPLDQRVVGVWRISGAINFALLLGFASLGALILVLAVPPAWPFVLAALLVILTGGVWLVYWYPDKAYQIAGYRLDEKVLEMRSGVVFRVVRLLPLTRLQHVDLHRGPLERLFGLASLVLHTAGTREAAMTVPGLDAAQAERLRNRLVEAGDEDGA